MISMMIALIKLPIRIEEYAHNFILNDNVTCHNSSTLQVSCVLKVDTHRSYSDLEILTIQTLFQDADLYFFAAGAGIHSFFLTSFRPALLTVPYFCLASHFTSASRNT